MKTRLRAAKRFVSQRSINHACLYVLWRSFNEMTCTVYSCVLFPISAIFMTTFILYIVQYILNSLDIIKDPTSFIWDRIWMCWEIEWGRALYFFNLCQIDYPWYIMASTWNAFQSVFKVYFNWNPVEGGMLCCTRLSSLAILLSAVMH